MSQFILHTRSYLFVNKSFTTLKLLCFNLCISLKLIISATPDKYCITLNPILLVGRRGHLMVSAHESRVSGLHVGLSPGQGHCVVVLCRTLYSHSASLCPGVMGTGKFNAGVTL